MGPVTQEITKSITNSYSFNLSLKQPLFTGFRIRNNSGKAADAYDASIAEYNRTRNELLVSVKKNYWTLVKALDAQKVINENLTVVTAYLNDITNYFDQGLSTKNEVLKARIRLSKVKVAKLEADNNVELAQLQLSVTMGKSESRPIYPLSVEYHESRNTDIEEGTLERALRMRFEKKALDAQIKAVEKDVSLSYSAWYPSVYVVGNLAYAQPNQRYFPPVEELKLSWDVGIFAGIDIAAWYSAAFRTEGASARLAMLADNAMQVDNGIAFDVTRALLNRNKAIEQVAVSTLILEQAEENCKIVSENYETGIAILSEALDAELQKNQAVLDLSIAKADYEIALIELDRATGAELIAGREGK
jgi:outer membrane protein TolC